MCKVTASESCTSPAAAVCPVGKEQPQARRRNNNQFKKQLAAPAFNSEKKGGVAKNPKRKTQEDKEAAKAKKESEKADIHYKVDENGNKVRVTAMEARVDKSLRLMSWGIAIVALAFFCYLLAWGVTAGLEYTGALSGLAWVIYKITGEWYRFE